MPEHSQYDGIARTYVSHGFDPHGTDGLVQAWMEKELGDMKGLNVVDAGCGTGKWFPKFTGACQIIGIDSSRRMLEQIPGAPRILDGDTALFDDVVSDGQKLTAIHGAIEEVLPQFRGRVDRVFASFSLCVCDEPKPVLRAMGASLKSGGRALVSTNVFVDQADAPTDAEPIREVNWAASPAIHTLHDGKRRELRIVLHLPVGDLPITDRVHVPEDYDVANDGFSVAKAHLIRPQGLTFVDGADAGSNRWYFSDRGGAHVASIRETRAALAHLCLELIAQ